MNRATGNPSPVPSFRSALRDATRTEHRALDESMSSLDLSSAAGYAAFLQIHVAALQLLRPDFRAEDRQEFDLLIQCARDDLGASVGPLPQHDEASGDYARALGISYVVRGSRLGAQFLRKRVCPAFPTSYLDCVTATAWPSFVLQLDAFGADCAADSWRLALAGARQAFGTFERCAGTFADPYNRYQALKA
jgi:heme oxygenase